MDFIGSLKRIGWAGTAILYWLLAYSYVQRGIIADYIPLPVLKALPLFILAIMTVFRMRLSGWKLVLGLLFSACGDIAGDVHGGGIIPQIGFFMMAQVMYYLAFRADVSWNPRRLTVIIPLLVWLVYIAVRLAMSPELTSPIIAVAVGIYLLVIMMMAVSAILRKQSLFNFIPVGAVLFVISDSVLAWHQFIGDVTNSGLVVMWSYYLAQCFIAFGYVLDHKITKIPSIS